MAGLPYRKEVALSSSFPGMNVNTPPLVRFRVSSQHLPPLTVTATDWMSALGAALHQVGQLGSIARMACERVSNGDVRFILAS